MRILIAILLLAPAVHARDQLARDIDFAMAGEMDYPQCMSFLRKASQALENQSSSLELKSMTSNTDGMEIQNLKMEIQDLKQKLRDREF